MRAAVMRWRELDPARAVGRLTVQAGLVRDLGTVRERRAMRWR